MKLENFGFFNPRCESRLVTMNRHTVPAPSTLLSTKCCLVPIGPESCCHNCFSLHWPGFDISACLHANNSHEELCDLWSHGAQEELNLVGVPIQSASPGFGEYNCTWNSSCVISYPNTDFQSIANNYFSNVPDSSLICGTSYTYLDPVHPATLPTWFQAKIYRSAHIEAAFAFVSGYVGWSPTEDKGFTCSASALYLGPMNCEGGQMFLAQLKIGISDPHFGVDTSCTVCTDFDLNWPTTFNLIPTDCH